MRLRRTIAAGVATTGVLAALLVWTPPAVAVTVPRTLAEQLPVGAGPVDPDFPVGYVGVVWQTDAAHDDGAGDGVAEPNGAVRFRHDGTWGPWSPLIEDGVEGPGQWASGLVPADGADAYQVRGLPSDARDARAVAINTTDGPPVTVATRPGGAAQAVDPSRCRSRAEWGAEESLRLGADGTEIWPAAFQDVQVMTVHHTATQNADPDPAATVRAIYRYHAVDQGWGDIGYQYLIDESGVVYEGRWSGATSPLCQPEQLNVDPGDGSAFGHEEDTDPAADRMVTGAHTGGWNSGNLGVALLGEFTTHRRTGGDPAPGALDALGGLLAELATRHGLDPLGTVLYTNPVSGEQRLVDTIGGHRDYTATECPGERLYSRLPTIREDVATRMRTPADTAPVVTLTSPVAGSTVAGNAVSLAAEATDDLGVAQVAFSVDGAPVGTDDDAAGGWSVTWDTITSAEGPHTVTATAIDTSGQTASHSVSVTVDNDGLTEPVHVADLDGSTRSGKGQWQATARVAVAGLGGTDATVHGTWSTGEPVDCTTIGGACSVTSPSVPPSTSSLTFTVTDVQHPTLQYDAARNTDPDGDSDGTTLTVVKGG